MILLLNICDETLPLLPVLRSAHVITMWTSQVPPLLKFINTSIIGAGRDLCGFRDGSTPGNIGASD